MNPKEQAKIEEFRAYLAKRYQEVKDQGGEHTAAEIQVMLQEFNKQFSVKPVV
jgi:cell fate (sporulation/competence/biofilm development) regulator YlbF (YheA/YmcA/DUF963 family)